MGETRSQNTFLDNLLQCQPFPRAGTDEYTFDDNPSLIRFTSLPEVLDIIRNRRLRFSSVSRFRDCDPTEGLGGLPLRPNIRGYGSIIHGQQGNSFSLHAKPTKHFPAAFWDEVSQENYSSLKQKILWAKQESANFLCSCFHVYHEEPYHMWELYGARSQGLAIYTSKEAVLRALPIELTNSIVLGWGEIFYAFNLAEAAQFWDDRCLPESLIRIKSSRFKSEHEFRFFLRAKQFVDYIYMPFNPEAVQKIILGPRMSDDDCTKLRSELLSTLQSQQLDIQVTDSEETQIRRLVERSKVASENSRIRPKG